MVPRRPGHLVRRRLEQAENEEQFQTVGLLCREVLISLAQVVFDPQRHPPEDGVTPSETDVKRMLDSYIGVELEGGLNEGVRGASCLLAHPGRSGY